MKSYSFEDSYPCDTWNNVDDEQSELDSPYSFAINVYQEKLSSSA